MLLSESSIVCYGRRHSPYGDWTMYSVQFDFSGRSGFCLDEKSGVVSREISNKIRWEEKHSKIKENLL